MMVSEMFNLKIKCQSDMYFMVQLFFFLNLVYEHDS